MAELFTPKILAYGQFTDTLATIFTATAKTHVRTIILVNDNSASETVRVEYSNGTTARPLMAGVAIDTKDDVTKDWRGEGFPLAIGDSLGGLSTTSNVVTYYVIGSEITEV